MKKQWTKPTVTEIAPPADPRYALWAHLLGVTGFTAVDDDLNTIIYLALRAADDDQLKGVGLEKVNR